MAGHTLDLQMSLASLGNQHRHTAHFLRQAGWKSKYHCSSDQACGHAGFEEQLSVLGLCRSLFSMHVVLFT